jgi:F-type H+-transporting ATPase subunit delta
MSDTTTQARPYARAVFKLAQEQGDLKGWSGRLGLMALVAADPTMLALVQSPRVNAAQLAELFAGICGKELGGEGQNLVRLLADNDRLAALPEIAALYEIDRAEAEGTVEAELVSAQPVDEAQQNKIRDALKARLNREVSLTSRIDPELLGGAVIRAGDMVIDGSVRGRLNKLAGILN